MQKFTECIEYRKELIESLNSKALIPGDIPKKKNSVGRIINPANLANAAEFQSLDLYGALRTLPKHSSDQTIEETSHPPPIGAPELSASNYKARAKVKGRESKSVMEEVSKKEMGKMKGKLKVLEKARKQEQGRGKSTKKDLVRRRDNEGGEIDAEKGVKKVKVDEEDVMK
jgi:hypothetical protein